MTRNILQDGVAPRATVFNAMVNGHGGEAVIAGCDLSAGTGTWEIDVASGSVYLAGTGEVSVGAQTVTVTDPASDADMDAGEARVDLVTIDTGGTATITEGTAASTPNSPDIPTDEVLLGWAYIRESDTSLAGSDINDERIILADDSGRYEDGGPHEIDLNELSGGNGTAGQYIVTDGAALSYQSLTADFATEEGSFTAGDFSAGPTTISLSNDYDLLTAWAGTTFNTTDEFSGSAGISDVDPTNDEITVEYVNPGGANTETIYWGVFGILA